MKIAYVIINANQREGTARAVVEVADRMSKTNEVHLFARTAEDLDLSAIHWHRVPGIPRPEVASFTTFLSFCSGMARPKHFSIIHSAGCNTTSANVYTIQNIQRAKIGVLARLAGDEKISLARRFTRRLYLRVTCSAEKWIYGQRNGRRRPLFLPVSRGVEAELKAHYDIGNAPVRVIPNGVDVIKFRPLKTEEKKTWREKNGLSMTDFVLVFAGGEWGRKGLDFAINALQLITNPRIKLFIAGDDPGRERFKGLASDLGVSNRIVFGGFRRDINDCLGAADLFLFPSWYEAFSLATLEAAASGLPVIATKINGTEDFIQPGINGEFITHDPAQIAAVLRPLISDISLCRKLGEAGRQLVEERYTWNRVVDAVKNAYEEYLSGPASFPCVVA